MNIDNFIKNIDLNNDDYVIVGVSSGPDSMALLHILETNLKCKIVCAHINHNVRSQSNEEELLLSIFGQKFFTEEDAKKIAQKILGKNNQSSFQKKKS